MAQERKRLGTRRAGLMAANSLEASLECCDLARMDAAAIVVASAHRDGIAAVRDGWYSLDAQCCGSFIDWLVGTATTREVNRALKMATGRDREEWLWVVG